MVCVDAPGLALAGRNAREHDDGRLGPVLFLSAQLQLEVACEGSTGGVAGQRGWGGQHLQALHAHHLADRLLQLHRRTAGVVRLVDAERHLEGAHAIGCLIEVAARVAVVAGHLRTGRQRAHLDAELHEAVVGRLSLAVAFDHPRKGSRGEAGDQGRRQEQGETAPAVFGLTHAFSPCGPWLRAEPALAGMRFRRQYGRGPDACIELSSKESRLRRGAAIPWRRAPDRSAA